VLGWAAAGPLGALATFGGTSIPFSLIAVLAGRYIREHASSVFVKSYKAGMAPSQLLFGKPIFPSFF